MTHCDDDLTLSKFASLIDDLVGEESAGRWFRSCDAHRFGGQQQSTVEFYYLFFYNMIKLVQECNIIPMFDILRKLIHIIIKFPNRSCTRTGEYLYKLGNSSGAFTKLIHIN